MRRSVDRNTTTFGDEIAQILRSIHPYATAKLISRDTGIKQRTVERMLDGSGAPGLDNFALLVRAYPSVLLVLLPAAPWLEAALVLLEQSRLDAAVAAMPAKRERAVAALRGRR